jgi:two-component system heavy metal sensor histidine kinase CusS
MPQKERRSWLLSRRITLSFGLVTSLLGLLFFALGLWAVHTAVEAQIHSLLQEEIEEMEAYLETSEAIVPEFDAHARELRGKHPLNRISWSLWRTDTGELLEEAADPRVVRPANFHLTQGFKRYPDGLWWGSGQLGNGHSIGVLIDVSPQLKLLDDYLVAAPLLLLVSLLAAILTSAWLGRRIAHLLHQAAEGVRAAQHAEDEVDAGAGAPEEIREVVLALRETLHAIKREVEGSRLLTSGLAHELRSPIQNLLGEAEVALLRERSSNEYRDLLESQLEELRDLARAIDNLVTLCAAGETRRYAGKERFDLRAELPLRLSRETALASRRGVAMEVESDGSLAMEGDREAILLALRNVITNAIDWSGEGGAVRVQLAGHNGSLEILVDDTGPGVPPAERETIFNPFHHGPAPARRRAGYGLGLALARTAVQTHGGSIEVGSSPLGGARFRIVLPSAPREL